MDGRGGVEKRQGVREGKGKRGGRGEKGGREARGKASCFTYQGKPPSQRTLLAVQQAQLRQILWARGAFSSLISVLGKGGGHGGEVLAWVLGRKMLGWWAKRGSLPSLPSSSLSEPPP
jgi:hypothetical protein